MEFVRVNQAHQLIDAGLVARASGKSHLNSPRIQSLQRLLREAASANPPEFAALLEIYRNKLGKAKMSRSARDVYNNFAQELAALQGLAARQPAKGHPTADAIEMPAERGGAPEPTAEEIANLLAPRPANKGTDLVKLRAMSFPEIQAAIGQAAAIRPKVFRFAPSPTGPLHIGGAWIALLNYLAAKSLNGKFLLRIEDTDRQRSKPEYAEGIKEGLKWLGIGWDGDVVHQGDPERLKLHKTKVKQLLDAGKAYREQKSGAIFFKMPREGQLVISDGVKGKVRFDLAEESMKDFVLQGADGAVKFLMANVVDDGEAGVTHIIRGDDHLNNRNAALQVLLFKALGYAVPEYFHVPLVLDDEGKKLSKRKLQGGGTDENKPTTLPGFRNLGVPRAALLDHLGRMGVKCDDKAVQSMGDLIGRFDIHRLPEKATKIGYDKVSRRSLTEMSNMEPDAVVEEMKKLDPTFIRALGERSAIALADGARTRAATFAEAIDIGKELFESVDLDDANAKKAHLSAEMRKLLACLRDKLAAQPADDWDLHGLEDVIEEFQDEYEIRGNGIRCGVYGSSLRWVLTGREFGFPIHHTLAILGPKESLKRLGAALDA